ncbi:MAG: M13 family metallopeptidase [Bacteroidota bacterium]|jgi:putative endopeptidase
MKHSTVLKVLLAVFIIAAYATAQNLTSQSKPIDPKNMDLSVKPCDNFYQYANGTWIKNNTIPPAFSQWGSFTELGERNNDVLHEILQDAAKDRTAPKGSNRQKIADMYATGMDSITIESLGWKPIAGDLERIDAIKDVAVVQAEIARLHTFGAGGVFGFSSGQDLKNSSEVIGQLSQGGLGMPDRDYYLTDDEKSKKLRDDYNAYIAAMFELVGSDDASAASAAKSIMVVETRLAKASRTRVERRDPDKNYNRMSQKDLSALTPAFEWNRFFVSVGWSTPGDVNVGQPEFFKEVNAMLKDIPLESWKNYLKWRVLNGSAPSLSSAFVNEHFKFHGAALTGAKELQPRWKRIKNVIDGLMGEALGELYVAKAFPPQAKARAMEMVNNIKAALREHIGKLQWMDDSTKIAALKKLDAFGVKIGYPDKWRDYSSLSIDRSSYLENVRRASAFMTQFQINKIGKPVDKTEWGMSPPTVNAYYNSSRNEIVFPAGILQPPFFDFNADDAVNYGGMGAVIGHEISHGFDDQGSKFDADGNLKMWWTPQTRKKFEERTAVLAKEFDGFVAIDTLHVNGKLTLGENIGDLGGLSISFTALEHSLKGKKTELIDGFTPEQRFFLSYAQVWRRIVTPEQLRLQVKTDSHSPANFRVNGPLVNLQEFYDAFHCGQEGTMFVPPEKRAMIWNYR